MKHAHRLVVAAVSVGLVAAAHGQTNDPRTAEGQLTACGGAAAWNAVGYLDFTVEIDTGSERNGPWRYRWDRRNHFFRITGAYPPGGTIDVALDLGSRSGGGWLNGDVLSGSALSDAVSWAFGRFAEDVLWLTFPLEWGAAGVTVTPGPDVVTADGVRRRTTTVGTQVGTWRVEIDPLTGLIARTVLERQGAQPLTMRWGQWRAVAGVSFASMRTVEQTGEVVRITVNAALAAAPLDAF